MPADVESKNGVKFRLGVGKYLNAHPDFKKLPKETIKDLEEDYAPMIDGTKGGFEVFYIDDRQGGESFYFYPNRIIDEGGNAADKTFSKDEVKDHCFILRGGTKITPVDNRTKEDHRRGKARSERIRLKELKQLPVLPY